MSVLGNILCRGNTWPVGRTLTARFARWLGRLLALRHRNVELARSVMIAPDARVNPRDGRIAIGERSLLASGAMVEGEVTIGDDSSVQNYTIIVGYPGNGAVRIGSKVRIAAHTMIIATNHVFADSNRPIHGQGLKPEPITIEDDVWIGGNVFITAGVTIGSGSVIGAGSVVTRSIPPRSVAVGAPARVIRRRE